MDTNDQQAIRALFEKLANVERQVPSRDAEAEHYINASISRQPGAPYYMAQTVVVQEHALNAAQSRIEALEEELAEARRVPQGGGFLSGLFGSGHAPRQTSRASNPMPQGAQGGFLAGAGQTAMGVAGGMILANAIGGMFTGPAEASEVLPEDEPDLGTEGFADDSDW
jgi:hypothetical protein